MLTTLLVALGALLLAVVGRAFLDPDTQDTNHREPPMIETDVMTTF